MSANHRPPTLNKLPSYLAGHVSTIGKRPLMGRLAEYDLRLPHFAVLVGLHDFGPTAQHELAEHLGFNRSHLVGYLDRLERAGYLVRTRDAEDRRRQFAELTPAGKKVAAELIGIAETTERTQLAVLNNDELRTLTTLLTRILDADAAP